MPSSKFRMGPKKKRSRKMHHDSASGATLETVSLQDIRRTTSAGTAGITPEFTLTDEMRDPIYTKVLTTKNYLMDPQNKEWKTTYNFRTVRVNSPPSAQAVPGPNANICTTHLGAGTSQEDESHSHQPSASSSQSTTMENQNSQRNKDTSYACRQQKLSDAWARVAPDLDKAFYKSQAPSTFTCNLCQAHDDNIIFCPDCGPMGYFCKKCAITVHIHSTFHIPLQWIGSLYCTFMWKKELKMPYHHCVTAVLPTWLILLDDKGREHPTLVHLCSCFSKAEAIIMLGFWPGSPVNPQTGIDLRFMNQVRTFLLEGAVALQKFCASIREHQKYIPVYPTRVDLYRVLSQECASTNRHFAERINNLESVVPNNPDGSKCPICTHTEGILPKIISLDGNFRLVRKASSGQSYREPLHGNKFFASKAEVQQYLEVDASSSTAHDRECSDFRAGDSKRSKFRSAKLDVSGLFGSVCIHDYPQVFIDLDSGEKLGYAALIIDHFKNTPAGLKVLYDIACRVKPKLQRMGINTNEIGLAVPVFHGYAHQAKCQVEYNPRLLENYRNADGENVERLWSYLGQFTYITREMTASNRRDLLIDALLHYGRKNIANAGTRLRARFEAAKSQEHESWVELGKARLSLRGLGMTVTEDILDSWTQRLKEQLTRHTTSVTTWQENYATVLNRYFSLKAQIVDPPVNQEDIERKAEVTRCDEKLKKVEEQHKLQRWQPTSQVYHTHLQSWQQKKAQDFLKRMHREAVERRHLILRKRDARGHDSASRISKQLKLTNARLQKLLRNYNELPNVEVTDFGAVKDTDAAIFQGLHTLGNLPYGLMKEAVVAHNRMKRCKEECEAIKIEFAALLQHHATVHLELEKSLEEDNMPPGVRAYIQYALLRNEEAQEEVLSFFIKTIPSQSSCSLKIVSTFSDRINHEKMALENSDSHVEDRNLVDENVYPVGVDDCVDDDDDDDDDDDAVPSSEEEDFLE